MQTQGTLKMIKMITSAIIVLVLRIVNCFAKSDGTFLIYNAHMNRCLGDDIQRLVICNDQNKRHQFRWTSESHIINVAQRKCLGIGSKTEGNKLQWYTCDTNSDLQKWECKDNLLFGLKNESLYLSVQKDTYLLTLSKDPGDEGKWTIHGTQKSICSQPFEELYTLQGNALGRPCHFPFHYNDRWYAECTTESSSNSRLWCAVESEYNDNELWGYCPTQQIDESWSKNPLTGMYYQVNENSALTWHQARKSCQQQGADLLSITEPHEQTFISGKTLTTGQALWTGLNSLDSLSGWQWINGQPLRYLKWLSGQPSSQPGHSCVVINQQYDSEWSTDICSAKHGYICQRGLSTPTVPPVVHTGYCPSPWIPYSGHCYLLHRMKRTWLDARDACRREGGDLLSILNTEEQSFVISQLGYLKTDELWIGFNDLKTPMLFEWSDHSSVPFAWWEMTEPSLNAALKEDCVLMKGEEGKWADKVCQEKYGYICKKKTSWNPSTNDTVVTMPGCKHGWIRYGYYCYLAGTETKSFVEAKQMCEKSGSYLADITNKVENAFLVSLVGARPEKHFWLGLSNQKDWHTFEWTNSRKVLFTHFNAGMPGRRQGCVAMATGMFAGLWDVLSCTDKEKYICKQKAEGIVTTPAPPTSPAPSCSDGWHPITNRDYCYKLFSVDTIKRKTWSEALDFCRELGGDLLSIHSAVDLQPVKYQYVPSAWIGYSIQNPSVGYVWSDGSSSSYISWGDGEPNKLNNMENCVTLSIFWWNVAQWNDLQCEDRQNWFCEIKKGVTPKEVNITRIMYNTTNDNWIIFKDNQYYIDFRPASMKEARKFCKHRHGDLVVINDEEERLFIWHQAKEFTDDIYIGMQIDLDKTFTWMDGSPVVFQAWSDNQPAFINDEEHCVKMTLSQGLWESVNCGDEQHFVCKRSGSTPINATVAPTEPSNGGCAPDWVKFEAKCYNIRSEPKTWTEARSYCRSLGGDLASITDRFQQAFLTLKMNENTLDLWLGFSNLAGRRFKWTDGNQIHFINWAKGQPAGYFHWHYNERTSSCAVMGAMQTPEPGKWVSKDCNDTNGFICSRGVDHFIKPSPTEEPKTFIQLLNSSYMVIESNLTWTEAQHHCEGLGAHLASIRDVNTQSYIELQTHKLGQPLWIGLNRMETGGYFLWIDNWHLNMERWHYNEPKKDHPCVYVDVDGGWKTAHCNQTYYSVCKKSTDIAPTRPSQYPGACPEQTEDPVISWLPYRGHCYAFTGFSKSWGSASLFCKIRGGSLVSIEDTEEAKFIENNINLLGNGNHFWIGLYQTSEGHWRWLDNTVVDYTNWGQYIDDNTDYYFSDETKGCAFISSTSKQWGTRYCEYPARLICKTAKVIKTTTEGKISDPAEHHVTATVPVVVVIAVLCALAGLAFFYHYRRVSRNQPAGDAFENPMYHSTVDPLSIEKDTRTLEKDSRTLEKDSRTLVDHMEVNEKHPPL